MAKCFSHKAAFAQEMVTKNGHLKFKVMNLSKEVVYLAPRTAMLHFRAKKARVRSLGQRWKDVSIAEFQLVVL